jgi:hypothetical protein
VEIVILIRIALLKIMDEMPPSGTEGYDDSFFSNFKIGLIKVFYGRIERAEDSIAYSMVQ